MPRRWRVHHARPEGPGREVVLDAEEAHHVRKVLRLAPGDGLGVFDGRGREWDARVVAVTPEVRLQVGRRLEDAVDPERVVRLYQGLCRAERVDWVVQKGTEVGVFAVGLVLAERVEAPRISPARLARWRRIAREAAKQCGRRRVPEVEGPVATPRVGAGVLGLLLDAGPATPALGRRLQERERRPPLPAEVWIAVGPPGGFTASEVQEWAGLGWRPAALGPRTLRAETAGVVAAAIVLHRWGDLGPGAGGGGD